MRERPPSTSGADHHFLKTFGVRIRAAREAKGWSQEKLAEHADIHDRTIGRIERGELNFSVLSLHRLLRALELPVGNTPLSSAEVDEESAP